MKNLKLYFTVKNKFSELTGGEVLFLGNRSISELNNLLYAMCGNIFYGISIPSFDIVNKFNLNEAVPVGDECHLVGAVYNDIYEEVHAVFSSGEIISLTVDKTGKVNFSTLSENIEFISEKILMAKWSPNLESVVLLNESNEIIVMGPSYNFLNATELLSSATGEHASVNVGWGKTETQFKGSIGKKGIVEETLDEVDDDFSTVISWRGDSLLFAVSYWCSELNMRRIKIFDKDGILQSIGENLAGLEVPMCWRPQGNLISLTQRFANRYVISFMEKNGLKHGEFNLPKTHKVMAVTWNIASTILGLVTIENTTNEYYILLWAIGNYHWYLKQSIKFCSKRIGVFWDTCKENRLYITTEDGNLNVMDFIWTVNHSCYSRSDTAYVSVIDNDKILLTSLDKAIIPPPMSSWEFVCPSSINQILFSPTVDRQNSQEQFLCAIQCDNKLSFFCLIDGLPILRKTLSSPLGNSENDTHMGIWEWVSKDTLICCGFGEGKVSQLYLLNIKEDKLEIDCSIELKNIITSVMLNGGVILLQMIEGRFLEFDISNKEIYEKEIFPEPCFNLITVEGLHYGLSESKRFYLGDKQIATNVTSFFVRKPFILVTTSHHTLLTFNINSDKFEEVSLRKLERGSKIIVVTGNSVIMQLPRGNLETIQPRALTILSIGSLLDEKHYKEAVHLMRKQRISFDLCIDHNRDEFIANVDKFVGEVDQQWIMLMVTQMAEYDVTQRDYSAYYNKVKKSQNDKIRLVCTAVLDSLMKQDPNTKNILARLSCLVKMRKMAEAISLGNDPNSLQHLLFLVDIETLYSEALGSYNLGAALKIAEKSQMDPKEYIPYLNSLKEMEPNYMKYTIDKSLNKYKSALEHIAKCGDEKLDECYNLIKEHSLYSAALRLFEEEPQRYSLCASLYGEYLCKKKCFEEAGIMYLRGNEQENAIKAYTKSGNWRQCLLLARQCSFSTEDIKQLGESLYNELISSLSYREARNVAIEILSNVEKGIDACLQGKLWQEAIYETSNYEKPQLLDSIKQHLLEAETALYEEISNKEKNMLKYVERLEVVREEKLLKPKFRDFDEMSDTSSSASSVKSFNSSFVSKSSKMTRKMSRKLWSLKEGNPREEEALVSALSELMISAEKCTGEVKNICCTLVYFKEDKIANKLQQLMKNWLQIIEKSKKTIWPKDPNEDVTFVLDQKLKYPPDMNIPPGWEFESLKDF